MDRSALRTQFSIQASTLADSYRSTVGRLRVGPNDYAPDMTAPAACGLRVAFAPTPEELALRRAGIDDEPAPRRHGLSVGIATAIALLIAAGVFWMRVVAHR